MLCRIGFRYARQIDPFDGGPHFISKTDEISLVKNAVAMQTVAVPSADAARPGAVIATEGKGDGETGETVGEFRATATRVIPGGDKGSLGLTEDVHRLLEIGPEQPVWMVIP